jgi:hypothetical protein
VSFIARAAAFLLVAATALVLAQTAFAAELGLSVAVDKGGKASVSVDIAAPEANASASAAASVDQAAPSVSAAVETGTAAVRVEVGGRPPTASGPTAPQRRAGTNPGTHRNGPGQPATRRHDRPLVAAAPSETAVPALEAPAPLATRAAGTGAPSDAGLVSLPERSAGGWGALVEAAATVAWGSPLALVALLLVAFSLVFESVLSAAPAPRPSLHSLVLERPG